VKDESLHYSMHTLGLNPGSDGDTNNVQASPHFPLFLLPALLWWGCGDVILEQMGIPPQQPFSYSLDGGTRFLLKTKTANSVTAMNDGRMSKEGNSGMTGSGPKA
jgi:hypothetical protein